MKLYIQLSMTLLWLGVLIPNVTRGQSPGSEEILQDFFSIASGSTSLSASESLFIGPGTSVDIPLILTAKSTISKGAYNISYTIDDNAGGEINNVNNTVTSDVSISL